MRGAQQVSDISDNSNIKSYKTDRNTTIYTTPNAQGNVILQFKVSSDALTKGVPFTYQPIEKSSLEREGNSSMLTYKKGVNTFYASESFNSADLASGRFKNYDKANKPKGQSPKEIFDDALKKSKDYSDVETRDTFHAQIKKGLSESQFTQKQTHSCTLKKLNIETLKNQNNFQYANHNDLILAPTLFLEGYTDKSVSELINSIQKLAGTNNLTGWFSWITDLVEAAWNLVKEAIDYITKQLEDLMSTILDNLGPLGDFIRNIVTFVQSLVDIALQAMLDAIVAVIEFLFNLIWPDGWEIAGSIVDMLMNNTPKLADSFKDGENLYITQFENLYNDTAKSVNAQSVKRLTNESSDNKALEKASNKSFTVLKEDSDSTTQIHDHISQNKFIQLTDSITIDTSTFQSMPMNPKLKDISKDFASLLDTFIDLAVKRVAKTSPTDLIFNLIDKSKTDTFDSVLMDYTQQFQGGLSSDIQDMMASLFSLLKKLNASVYEELQTILKTQLITIPLTSQIFSFFKLKVDVNEHAFLQMAIFIGLLTSYPRACPIAC